MPIHRAMQSAAFDAAAAMVIIAAFDDALRELGLERGDPLVEIVARKIIVCARSGERDPTRLRELATAGMCE